MQVDVVREGRGPRVGDVSRGSTGGGRAGRTAAGPDETEGLGMTTAKEGAEADRTGDGRAVGMAWRSGWLSTCGVQVMNAPG